MRAIGRPKSAKRTGIALALGSLLVAAASIGGASAAESQSGFYVKAQDVENESIVATAGLTTSNGSAPAQGLPDPTAGVFAFTIDTDAPGCTAPSYHFHRINNPLPEGYEQAPAATLTSPSGEVRPLASGWNETPEDGVWVAEGSILKVGADWGALRQERAACITEVNRWEAKVPDGSFSQDASGAFQYAHNLTKVVDPPATVRNMNSLFKDARVNVDLTGWDTSKVTDMGRMFAGSGYPATSSFNQDISGWDVSSVEAMDYMFAFNDSFDQPIGKWKPTSLKKSEFMFYQATAFDQDLSGWKLCGQKPANFALQSFAPAKHPSFEGSCS